MLQRAASNAYSWWWASHIRTKQSKWLDQNLQDMEEKVQNVLKLLQEDGDSFAKRAEMYYKKRPELIAFVEESYRAYRALAERYNHLSTDLQNANNTIASVFPEQVQFAMDDDYDFSPRTRPPIPERARPNIPKVPSAPIKDLKSLLATSARKLKKNNDKEAKKPSAAAATVSPSKSGLSKDKAFGRIDKVQKEILALQTVKEFVKSSYEGGLTRYWEIEKQITVMQEEVSALQDEFGEGMVIEDDEARRLMATAALRSCQEILSQLHEKHWKSTEEVQSELERMKDSWNKLKSLKKEILPREIIGDTSREFAAEIEKEREEELGPLEEKIKQQLEAEFSGASLTATEMVEKIDVLVEKVIGLEMTLASQAALMERLRAENDHLQAQIQAMEDNKGNHASDSESTKAQIRMKQMEEKLHGIHVLNQSIRDQSKNLQTDFTEVHFNLERLSEKLTCIQPDEDEDIASIPTESATDSAEVTLHLENELKEEKHKPRDVLEGSREESFENVPTSSKVAPLKESWQTFPDEEQHAIQRVVAESRAEQAPDAITIFERNTCLGKKEQDGVTSGESDGVTSGESENPSQVEKRSDLEFQQEEPNWRELFLKGMENREKTLLAEYTTVLRNYKEVKKKLNDVEKKDEEILSLRKRVSLLQTVLDEQKDSKDLSALSARGIPEIHLVVPDEQGPSSEVEQKLRMDIDQVLEENLEFWLRLSSTLHQIQKYETAVEDLQAEVLKLEEKEKSQEGSHSRRSQSSFRSEVRPIYKHLKEIHNELAIWSEKCTQLKDEQQSRFSSLCSIQEEITKALKVSAEDDEFKFTSYQSAKFQGEVLNMKQENNKVANELHAGLDHIMSLRGEVERTLAKVNEKLGFPGSKEYQNSQLKQAINRAHVPLHSFIFGTKQKKHRASIFASMNPMLLHRRDNPMRSGQSAQSSLWRQGTFRP